MSRMSHMPHGRRSAGQSEAREAETRAVAAFLRGLAARVESDPALAVAVRGALEESGLPALSDTNTAPSSLTQPPRSARPPGRLAQGNAPPSGGEAPALEPFVVYREYGETALRAALEELDLAALRGIVRAHRLDPARISARWTAADRLIALIVQQVQAHANSGRAFARV